MNLCSNNHEEICHEGRHCPVCELIAEHEDKISTLENKLAEAQDQITSLHDQIG